MYVAACVGLTYVTPEPFPPIPKVREGVTPLLSLVRQDHPPPAGLMDQVKFNACVLGVVAIGPFKLFILTSTEYVEDGGGVVVADRTVTVTFFVVIPPLAETHLKVDVYVPGE